VPPTRKQLKELTCVKTKIHTLIHNTHANTYTNTDMTTYIHTYIHNISDLVMFNKVDENVYQTLLDCTRRDLAFGIFLQHSHHHECKQTYTHTDIHTDIQIYINEKQYQADVLELLVILQEEGQVLICHIHIRIGPYTHNACMVTVYVLLVVVIDVFGSMYECGRCNEQ
jgi:hypothetical protein